MQRMHEFGIFCVYLLAVKKYNMIALLNDVLQPHLSFRYRNTRRKDWFSRKLIQSVV